MQKLTEFVTVPAVILVNLYGRYTSATEHLSWTTCSSPTS